MGGRYVGCEAIGRLLGQDKGEHVREVGGNHAPIHSVWSTPLCCSLRDWANPEAETFSPAYYTLAFSSHTYVGAGVSLFFFFLSLW